MMLLWIVEEDALFEVCSELALALPSNRMFAPAHHGLPPERLGLARRGLVRGPALQVHGLFGISPGQYKIATNLLALERVEQTLGVLAQFPCSRVGFLYLGGGKALDRRKRHTHGALQSEFLLVSYGCIRQRLQQL